MWNKKGQGYCKGMFYNEIWLAHMQYIILQLNLPIHFSFVSFDKNELTIIIQCAKY